MAKFRAEDGRVVMRSTKQTDLRAARKVAEKWEDASRRARAGELTQAASIRILGELMEITTAESLVVETVGGFLRSWLASRDVAGRAASTVTRYKPVIEGFIASLPPVRAKANVASVTPTEIERFRDGEVKAGKGATTANFAIKVLRAAFNAARRKGLALTNPADAAELIEAHAEERAPFSDDELRALLRTAAGTDWQGAILLGVWTGLRLGDLAALIWEKLNLDNGTLTFAPQKTSRRSGGKLLTLKLHAEVLKWLRARPAGVGAAPLLPEFHGRRTGSAAGLSNAFAALMVRAGIVQRLGVEKKGKGRRFRGKGFHALRHTLISRLANADVSADVRKAMAGHSSDAVHRRYTHLDVSAQERALAGMPGIAA